MRILTNRNFKYEEPFQDVVNKSVEFIEKNENGWMWKGDDYSDIRIEENNEIKIYPVSFGFPVDEEFVKSKFTECGRQYKSVDSI